jgi:cell division protein FtsB
LDRPAVSQMVINEFTKLIDLQDVKGIAKYNKTIDEANNADYNWMEMAGEELADMFKYLVKEIIRLKAELHVLKCKSWFKVHSENIALAKENERLREENKKLKDDKDLFSKLFIKSQLKE